MTLPDALARDCSTCDCSSSRDFSATQRMPSHDLIVYSTHHLSYLYSIHAIPQSPDFICSREFWNLVSTPPVKCLPLSLGCPWFGFSVFSGRAFVSPEERPLYTACHLQILRRPTAIYCPGRSEQRIPEMTHVTHKSAIRRYGINAISALWFLQPLHLVVDDEISTTGATRLLTKCIALVLGMLCVDQCGVGTRGASPSLKLACSTSMWSLVTLAIYIERFAYHSVAS